MPRRAKRRTRPRIDEHIVLFRMNVLALVQIRRRSRRARARTHARAPVADQLNRCQRPIALRSDSQLLVRIRPVRNNVLLPAV